MAVKNPNRRIDVILPGLDDDRPQVKLAVRDRLQRASGTSDRRVKLARVAMLHDLAARPHWATLRAIRDGRVTIERVHRAYKEGPAALEQVLRECERVLLWPLAEQFAKERPDIKEMRHRLDRLKRFCEWLGGTDHATVAMFTTEMAARWLAEADAYDMIRKTRKAPAASTINGYRVTLSTFATWLLQRGYLERHPIAHKLVPKRDLPQHRMPEPFTAEDYARYREAVLAYRFDAGLLLLLAVHTGADRDELRTKLQARDVRFGVGGAVTKVRLQRPKWKKARERLVPIPDEIAAMVRAQLAHTSAVGETPVFAEVTQWAVTAAHQRGRGAIGRPRLRVKDLRHIAAINWVQSGVDIQMVKTWLGHSTLSQTAVYVDYMPKEDHEAELTRRSSKLWLAPEHSVMDVPQIGSARMGEEKVRDEAQRPVRDAR